MSKTPFIHPTRGGSSPRAPDDDERALEELPPIDGDLADAPASDPNFSDLVDDAEPGGEGALDDTTSEDEPLDASELPDPGDQEDGVLEESSDAADLDVGELTLAGFGAEQGLTHEDDRPPEDATSPLDDEAATLADGGREGSDLRSDVGEEGPIGDEDAVSEDDLPDMDADEQGAWKTRCLSRRWRTSRAVSGGQPNRGFVWERPGRSRRQARLRARAGGRWWPGAPRPGWWS